MFAASHFSFAGRTRWSRPTPREVLCRCHLFIKNPLPSSRPFLLSHRFLLSFFPITAPQLPFTQKMTPNNNHHKTTKSDLHSLPVFFLPKDLLEALIPEAPSSATDTSQLVLANHNTTFHNYSRKEDETLYTHDTPSTSSSSPSYSAPTTLVRLPLSTPAHSSSQQVAGAPLPPRVAAPSPSCRICNMAHFGSVQLQRDHAKSDWHRYNLKHSLLDKEGFLPISEQQFENILQHISSISASEDDDYGGFSDDVEKSQKPVQSSMVLYQSTNRNRQHGPMDQVQIQSLMQKLEVAVQQKVEFRNSDPVKVHLDTVLEQKVQEARETPLIWFKAPAVYGSTVRLGVYKNTLFPRQESNGLGRVMEALQEAQIERPALPPKKMKMKRAARAAAAAAAAEAELTKTLKDGEEEIVELSLATEISAAEDNQEVEKEKRPPRYWTMFLLGGGHFAGMVVDLAGESPKYGQGKNQNAAPDIKIVVHKTFHRYTVRKKNGGAQGTHGSCNSAGARIRMYNETALKLEVRELVDSWKSWIDQSETVFLHAPGNNRKTFIHDDSLMAQVEKQGRVRSLPFMTRRPTLTELKRAFRELTTVKVERLDGSQLESEELAEQEALENAFSASQSRFLATVREIESDSDSASDKEELSARLAILPPVPQESVLLEHSTELQKWVEMVKKGRLEAMSSHLDRNLDTLHPSRLLPQNPRNVNYDRRRTPTILHLAAHSGHPQLVQRLLERHGADPTATVTSLVQQQNNLDELYGTEPPSDSDGLFEPALLTPKSFGWTAYDVAKDKETRDAFRRVMTSLPDRWDWVTLAHVPSALTPEMEAKAAAVAAAAAIAEQERQKAQETKRSKKTMGSSDHSLDSSSSTMGSDDFESTLKAVRLSDELRMKIDRERRAQAAEDRFAAARPSALVGGLFYKEDPFTEATTNNK